VVDGLKRAGFLSSPKPDAKDLQFWLNGTRPRHTPRVAHAALTRLRRAADEYNAFQQANANRPPVPRPDNARS
jgi:hypothetical protein